MIKRSDLNFFSTYLLAEEAQKRGIKVSRVMPNTKISYLKLEYNGKVETIVGQRISKMGYNAHIFCKRKNITRELLKENGIKTTEGKLFQQDQIEEALEYFESIKEEVVIKPSDGTWGSHVYLGITSKKEAISAIENILKTKNEFLIERQFRGKEFRVLSTNEKLLGVINRIPANVIGDGVKNIEALIEEKNSDPMRGEGHEKSLVKIKIDENVVDVLKSQNLNISDVPKKGEQIFLRQNSNLSTGGDSYDITDEIHPKYFEIAPRVISSIPNLLYGGFDLLTPDITKDPEEVGYAVIEINDSPMLSMHHFPYQGKKRNVSKDVIDILYPETKYE